MEGNCQAMILKQSQEVSPSPSDHDVCRATMQKVAIVERERDGMEHQAMTEMRGRQSASSEGRV